MVLSAGRLRLQSQSERTDVACGTVMASTDDTTPRGDSIEQQVDDIVASLGEEIDRLERAVEEPKAVDEQPAGPELAASAPAVAEATPKAEQPREAPANGDEIFASLDEFEALAQSLAAQVGIDLNSGSEDSPPEAEDSAEADRPPVNPAESPVDDDAALASASTAPDGAEVAEAAETEAPGPEASIPETAPPTLSSLDSALAAALDSQIIGESVDDPDEQTQPAPSLPDPESLDAGQESETNLPAGDAQDTEVNGASEEPADQAGGPTPPPPHAREPKPKKLSSPGTRTEPEGKRGARRVLQLVVSSSRTALKSMIGFIRRHGPVVWRGANEAVLAASHSAMSALAKFPPVARTGVKAVAISTCVYAAGTWGFLMTRSPSAPKPATTSALDLEGATGPVAEQDGQ